MGVCFMVGVWVSDSHDLSRDGPRPVWYEVILAISLSLIGVVIFCLMLYRRNKVFNRREPNSNL